MRDRIRIKLESFNASWPIIFFWFFVLAGGSFTSVDRVVDGPKTSSSVLIALPDGVGSGVYVGDGVIITAAHVVEGNSTVRVYDSAGSFQEGRVVWSNKEYDVAQVSVSDKYRYDTSRISCSPLRLGDSIRGVGNPHGIGWLTKWGHVSSEQSRQVGRWKDVFIVDMTIESGMSGGAVFNTRNNVAGIMVGVYDSAVSVDGSHEGGIGFIVPSTDVCDLMKNSGKSK